MDDAKTKELLPIYADAEIGARILAAMEAYRKGYVYSPEYGSDHEPTDFEQVLLEDFLNGAFTDEVSAILQEAARAAAPQPAASDVPHDVVRALERWDAWRKYIANGGKASWPRDEFEALIESLATLAPSTSTAAEVYGWHRSKGGFEIDFMRGPDRPRNATSAPDEWVPLYTAVPSSTEEALRAENARLREAAQAVLDAETVNVHVGYDGAAGGGNFVYADAIRTDDEAFDKLRSALSR